MGLLARLKGKGKADGTDDEAFVRRLQKRQKIFDVVTSRLPKLSLVLFIAGFISMAAIPAEPLGKLLRVSENAVQAGQVTTYWDWQDVFVADKYAQDVQEWSQLSSLGRAENLEAAFKQLGLPASSQHYNFTNAGNSSGINTYAVLKAPKTDGSEAIVLGASWLSRDGRRVNTRGVALLVGLAKHLSKYSVWSKDIIFLISDGYSEGAHAWISAYHSVKQTNLQAEPLQLTLGSIWAALHLDYPHHSFSKIGLYFEGINGLLPNLDLIAAAGHITRWHAGVPLIINNGSDVVRPDKHRSRMLDSTVVKEYELAAENVFEQVKRQSVGTASGPEGVYAPFRIDALAFFAVPAQGPHGFFALGKIAEASLRSINNLLERFHASAFLYILSTPRRFVPLAHYLAAPLLCGLAFSVLGLSHWSKFIQATNFSSSSLIPALSVVLTSHGFGWLAHRALTGSHEPSDVISLLWALLPTSLLFAAATAQLTPSSSILPLQAINFLFSGMFVSAAAVVNFSFACLCVFLLLPACLTVVGHDNFIMRSLQLALLLATTVQAIGLLLPQSAISSLLFDWHVLGTWFLDFVALILVPLNIQALVLSCVSLGATLS